MRTNKPPILPQCRDCPAVWEYLAFLCTHTQIEKRREIFLNQTEIRSYIPFSDWSIVQINQKMVNTIWFQVDLIRFRKDFSVCTPYAENFFMNLVKSNQIWIVITLIQLIWHQAVFRFGDQSIRKVKLQSKFGLI